MSTPYNPQFNGHAESAVKTVKHLIQKVASSGNLDCEAFDRAFWSSATPPAMPVVPQPRLYTAIPSVLVFQHTPGRSRRSGKLELRAVTAGQLPVTTMLQIGMTPTPSLFYSWPWTLRFDFRTRRQSGGTWSAPS